MSDQRPLEATTEGTADPRLFLPVVEVAAKLGVSRMTVIRAIRDGELPCGRFGRKYLIPRNFIDGLISEVASGRQVVIKDYAAAWFAQAGEGAA